MTKPSVADQDEAIEYQRTRVQLPITDAYPVAGPDIYPPLPTADVPLADAEAPIPARELLAREQWEVPPPRRVAPWLVFVAWAVAVPLLFAVLAVLAGCVPVAGDPVAPVVEVSTDSPDAGVLPEGVR